MNIKSKVVRVTATEFELDDGRVFQHIMALDPVPTPKEFQAFYDKASYPGRTHGRSQRVRCSLHARK